MKRIAVILILAGIAGAAAAQPEEVDNAYFHPAASLYIHGDSVAASNLVEQGLSLYPHDAKLKRLKDLLEQQQQQQNDQQQDQNDQNQDEQDQDEQNPDEQEQDNREQPDDQQQQNGDQEQPPAEQDSRPAEEMTPEEARQLLDAMKQEEKNERMLLRPVLGNPIDVEKDW